MARTKQTKNVPPAVSAKRNAKILEKVRNRLVLRKKEQPSSAAVQHERKPRRWRPGTVAKREIRKLSRSTNLLFPKLSFSRLVREVCQDLPRCSDKRFTKNAMMAIQVCFCMSVFL